MKIYNIMPCCFKNNNQELYPVNSSNAAVTLLLVARSFSFPLAFHNVGIQVLQVDEVVMGCLSPRLGQQFSELSSDVGKSYLFRFFL